MYIYSAHDTTVANILSTLGVFERHCPPYASTVLAELYKMKNTYYVSVSFRFDLILLKQLGFNTCRKSKYNFLLQILYKNSSEARILTLPGCSELCELDKFISLTKPNIPESWEKECHYHLLFSSEDLNDLSISGKY